MIAASRSCELSIVVRPIPVAGVLTAMVMQAESSILLHTKSAAIRPALTGRTCVDLQTQTREQVVDIPFTKSVSF